MLFAPICVLFSRIDRFGCTLTGIATSDRTNRSTDDSAYRAANGCTNGRARKSAARTTTRNTHWVGTRLTSDRIGIVMLPDICFFVHTASYVRC
jgi:hypothetical protein